MLSSEMLVLLQVHIVTHIKVAIQRRLKLCPQEPSHHPLSPALIAFIVVYRQSADRSCAFLCACAFDQCRKLC